MSRKLIWLGMLSLVLAPGGAMSLGLGEIRLESYLNQPLNAQIALSAGSSDELSSLKVGLASQEAFNRRGVPRPAYLNGLKFRIDRSAPGGAIIAVTSDAPIVEPFVTFLVEAQWSGGRVLREYTVLLDPPVFTAGQAGSEAPQARRSEPTRRPSTSSEPPAAQPDPSPAPGIRASAEPGGYSGAEYGPVQRNETLYRIAERVRPDGSVTTNQVMMALFHANPGAFDGNINRLRAGAILRVPPRQEIGGVAAREATAEVRRHMDDWRGAAPQAERLVLAPPSDGAAPAAPATRPGEAGSGADQGQLMGAVQDLRNQLEETRRLMEVKDAEIAALQQRLADLEAGAPADTGAAPPAEGQAGGEEAFDSEARSEVTPTDAEPVPGDEAAAEAPEPAVAPRTEPVAPTPAQPAAAAPSLLDRVLGVLGSLWLWLLIGLALVAAAGVYFLRNRDSRSIEEDLAETGTWGTLEPARAAAALGGGESMRTGRGRSDADGPSIVVEEQHASPVVRERPAATTEPETPEEDYRYPFEDTIAGETGINLDQSDPLAEADFHMAYGLYDQAAEIIKKAIEREPDRYDLRRKLLDICFVWGNSEEFIAQAREVRQMSSDEATADWGKVAIMGRQISPGEPMFAAAGEEIGEVDVDFEASATGAPDFDLSAGTGEGEGEGEGEDWLDFDVGESAEGFGVGDTRQQPALRPGSDETAELNLEDLGIDLDLGETGEHALRNLAERAPELSAEEAGQPAVQPEEESDDGTLMMEAGDYEEVSSDAPTASSEQVELENEPTWIGKSEEPTLTSERAEDPTTEVESVDEDLDLDDLASQLRGELDETREARAASDDDLTQLAPELPPEWSGKPQHADPEADTREMAPVTMSEVGTKLDLARAYIDMGDPDGARSILEEVLDEGDDAQQDEAKQLLATLD